MGVCKFCGKESNRAGGGLVAAGSLTCQSSPTKKHILVADGKHCVFCGGEAKPSGGGLNAGGSLICAASPSKKHQLAD
jgi:hypothetical protein